MTSHLPQRVITTPPSPQKKLCHWHYMQSLYVECQVNEIENFNRTKYLAFFDQTIIET